MTITIFRVTFITKMATVVEMNLLGWGESVGVWNGRRRLRAEGV